MSVNLGNDTKAASPVRTPDEAKESKYEPKQNKKIVRLLTVIAYVISVSMAAIILSLYYVFLWDPSQKYPTRSPPMDTSHFALPGTGEAHIPADNMMESQPTPRVLPLMQEGHHHSTHQIHPGQFASTQSLSNDNSRLPGPSPQQGFEREASSSRTPHVSEELRHQHQHQQQQHGHPPISASA
ncbi:hypothetical protein SK128_019417 [Halocaridina rubra]|uniref:Transmembrane protein INAFM2 n=1 Tax=Halocaridina rubra TaxID=373956 RepID=A0AAN8X370_HALRR